MKHYELKIEFAESTRAEAVAQALIKITEVLDPLDIVADASVNEVTPIV